MKKLMMMATLMIASVCAVSAQEEVKEVETSPLSFDVTADLYSAYVWRGIVVNKHAVLQPGASATADLKEAGSISASVWSDFNLAQNSRHGANQRSAFGGLDELDFTASYAIDLGDFALSAGHIWYTFPQANGSDYGSSTEEIFLTLAYKNDVVTPFIALNYDYNLVEGYYANAGLAKQIEIDERLSAGCEVSLGAGDADYNKAYFGASDGLLDFNASVFLAYAVNENITVGAKLVWMSLVDEDMRDNADQSDILWGGISLSASF